MAYFESANVAFNLTTRIVKNICSPERGFGQFPIKAFLILIYLLPIDHNITGQPLLSAEEQERFKPSENQLLDLKIELIDFKKSADTIAQINSLIDIAYFYGTQARYKESYDYLWQALSLSESSENNHRLDHIYLKLGRHYGYYKRSEEAEKYFKKSLELRMKKMPLLREDSVTIAETYFSMCSFYRENSDLENQQQYIDSCKVFYKNKAKPVMKEMMKMQEAVIVSGRGNLKQANERFKAIIPIIDKLRRDYSIIPYYFHAQNLIKLGNWKEALKSLDNAIIAGEEQKTHMDFIPRIYESYAQIYASMNNHDKALEMRSKVFEWSYEFFDSRSSRNHSLLEIQDEYTLNKNKEALEIQKLRLEELENSEKILFLQRSLLGAILIASLLFLFNYIKNLRNKFRLEKSITKRERDMEFEQIRRLVELKNRELATSALKLIEKEEIVQDFEKVVKSKNYEPEPRLVKSFFKSWGRNSNKNWDEFQKRFIDINKSFYEKLHSKYPKLTGSEGECKLNSV